MAYDPKLHHRRSIRLPGWDYAQAGAYFVTLCTQGHLCLFGKVIAGAMQLNEAGHAAERCWREIPAHLPRVELDEFTVMPNHLHGILIIVGANDDSPQLAGPSGEDSRINASRGPCVGANHNSRLRRAHGTSATVGSVVRGFKTGVTLWMRRNVGIRDVWQRSYYEHVIRGEGSANLIRQYIANNPASWMLDTENPQAKPTA